MKNEKIKNKIKKLKNLIKKYSFYYFKKHTSIINDEKYDQILEKLKLLENKYPIYKSKNSPTQKIIYKVNKTFKHKFPMLSIQSIYTYKKLYKFINKIYNKYYTNIFCCELKIDGIAISLIYKNNILYKALTRGNGLYGENITNIIKYIKSIPKILKNKIKNSTIEIRGEIFINKKNFNKINKFNNKKYSNTRNLTAGTINSLNKKLIKKRKLSFLAYYIIINNNKSFIKNHYKSLLLIKKIGFNIDKYTKIYNSYKNIIKYYKKILSKRNKIKFNIDGIVIKVNNIKIQNLINYNNKYIKWAIALKFPSQTKTTKVLNIKYKIGITGIIIPIIIIKPININGVIIRKINLYNLNYLKKTNIVINNKILIERKGDVIPKIIKNLSYNKNKKNILIKKCPSCKSLLNYNILVPKCNNINCIEKIKNNIIKIISKQGFNIKYLGPKTIKLFLKKKIIKNSLDLLKLKINKLYNKLKYNKKKFYKIIKSIHYSIKNIKLYNLIFILSVPKIGYFTSIYISKKIKTIKNLLIINNINKLKNLTKNKKKSLIIYLNNKKNINYIKNLQKICKKYNNNL